VPAVGERRETRPGHRLLRGVARALAPLPAGAGNDNGHGNGNGNGGGAIPKPPGRHERLELNTATIGQLLALPGVGPSPARAILELRTARGGFKFPRDLLEVPGMGEERFRAIRPLLTVDREARP